jgi:hypothetical protein
MHKSATKCNETIGKWCKNKHGASKIIDTFETYQMMQVVEMCTRGAGFEVTCRGQWWRGWGAAVFWTRRGWTVDDVILSEGDESLLRTPFVRDIDSLLTRLKTTRLFCSCSFLFVLDTAVLLNRCSPNYTGTPRVREGKRIRFTWNLNSVYQAVKKKNRFSWKIILGSGSGILKFKISSAQFFPK